MLLLNLETTPGFEPGTFFLTREILCTPVNCGGLADSCARSNGYKMVRQWLQTYADR